MRGFGVGVEDGGWRGGEGYGERGISTKCVRMGLIDCLFV